MLMDLRRGRRGRTLLFIPQWNGLPATYTFCLYVVITALLVYYGTLFRAFHAGCSWNWPAFPVCPEFPGLSRIFPDFIGFAPIRPDFPQISRIFPLFLRFSVNSHLIQFAHTLFTINLASAQKCNITRAMFWRCIDVHLTLGPLPPPTLSATGLEGSYQPFIVVW